MTDTNTTPRRRTYLAHVVSKGLAALYLADPMTVGEASQLAESLRLRFVGENPADPNDPKSKIGEPETRKRSPKIVAEILSLASELEPVALIPLSDVDAQAEAEAEGEPFLTFDDGGLLYPAEAFNWLTITDRGAFEPSAHDGGGELARVGSAKQHPTTRPVPLNFESEAGANGAPKIAVRITGTKAKIRLSRD